jgi:hypothetical protein
MSASAPQRTAEDLVPYCEMEASSNVGRNLRSVMRPVILSGVAQSVGFLIAVLSVDTDRLHRCHTEE